MKFEFEKEFRADHPETVGETDKEFDQYNYMLWLERQLRNCNLQSVSQQRELLFKFHSWYNDEYATSALDSNRIVDEYIKTNSA